MLLTPISARHHVKNLAKMAKALTATSWIVHLNQSDFASDFELSQRIYSKLAYSHPVILKGCTYKPVDLTIEDLTKKLGLSMGQLYCVHVPYSAKQVDDYSYLHVSMDLEMFINGVSDNSCIQCILDCPTLDGSRPSLIK
ncbi:hypothetical protein NLJ89_g11112 [Agrocybe chaxingu]|uniref:Uncharacterized protein n=1 Tax=Agrocybe chaxingu TaxID=84603 RepID=A0A9W8MPN3_9AGAR|nr:hypothetical protein NLJ89_g11112 [Agrocybe chaxingu]